MADKIHLAPTTRSGSAPNAGQRSLSTAQALADVLVRATEAVAVAVAGLRNLKKADVILTACLEVNRLENEGDQILRGALADLFRGASDPLLVLKWKEVYDALENATDRCEDVANVIEGVVLEHA